jgi:hypothetical protein
MRSTGAGRWLIAAPMALLAIVTSDFGMVDTYPGLIAAYVSQFLLSRVLPCPPVPSGVTRRRRAR